MVRITEELLRKRSEHNDGCLTNLKEITLHQYDIEKIECISDYCRELQILYLQSNLIEKIENLQHLKDLRYLNMAVNSVKRIEGLSSNEMLEKLDLTVNYITDLMSVEALKANYNLKDLYLMGNPCASYKGYRHFVIETLPQLMKLDGEEITQSERILARQYYDKIRAGIIVQQDKQMEEDEKRKNAPQQYGPNGEPLYGNDPESRKACKTDINEAREEAKSKASNPSSSTEDGSGGNSYDPKTYEQMFGKRNAIDITPEEEIEKYGKVLQRNEGKWDFKIMETKDSVIVDIPAGKYMNMAYIDIDVQPTYLRVTIKGKVLQLRLECEVKPDATTAQRSQVTGNLKITMPKVSSDSKLTYYAE